MLRTEATRIQESINDSFNNATYNGKNVFQTMNFVVGSGTETTNLNPLATDGLSIDNQDSITNFMDQLGSLRSEEAQVSMPSHQILMQVFKIASTQKQLKIIY